MQVHSSLYLYPWAIEDFADFARGYAATGCSGVAPALSYHHGHAFYARTGRFAAIDTAALSFAPSPSLYEDLIPAVHPGADKTTRQLRDWCGKTSRSFSAWTVLLHNSTLGAAHPECTVENFLGDRYAHALCSSHPQVRHYTRALLEDICTQLVPDSVMAESATLQPAQHGCHHEIANVPFSPVLRWLYSLCFCPHCMEKAAAQPGLDPEKARAQAADLARRLLAGEAQVPLATVLLERPGLYLYQRARQAGTTDYIRGIHSLLQAQGVALHLIPSAVPFPLQDVYMEGAALSDVSADVLVPLVYGEGETYAGAQALFRLWNDRLPLGMAASLLHHQGPDSLQSCVENAHSAGCRHFYFYNFSLASQPRLDWLARANQALLQRSGP